MAGEDEKSDTKLSLEAYLRDHKTITYMVSIFLALLAFFAQSHIDRRITEKNNVVGITKEMADRISLSFLVRSSLDYISYFSHNGPPRGKYPEIDYKYLMKDLKGRKEQYDLAFTTWDKNLISLINTIEETYGPVYGKEAKQIFMAGVQYRLRDIDSCLTQHVNEVMSLSTCEAKSDIYEHSSCLLNVGKSVDYSLYASLFKERQCYSFFMRSLTEAKSEYFDPYIPFTYYGKAQYLDSIENCFSREVYDPYYEEYKAENDNSPFLRYL